MAKSKSGGTRSYIRGKIGADVYSIGKNGKGDKQQVVRSLAEVVSNPQTDAQMRGRMYMSTVMQTLSVLSPIIDHSFDDVPNGQPSLSEFIRLNYALVKADAVAHPSSGNTFGINLYQVKGTECGKYQISKGSVIPGNGLALETSDGYPCISIDLSSTDGKVQDMLDAAGLNLGDYITGVALLQHDGLHFMRAYIKKDIDPTTAITSENVASLFETEGSEDVEVEFENSHVRIYIEFQCESAGMIVSKKEGSAWKHNTAKMVNVAGYSLTNATTAFATYPQGSSRFLNGGDI